MTIVEGWVKENEGVGQYPARERDAVPHDSEMKERMICTD